MTYNRMAYIFSENFSPNSVQYCVDYMHEREWPLFKAAEKLKRNAQQFFVFTFENPALYTECQQTCDVFFKEVLSDSPDTEKVIGVYEKLISLNRRRNRLDAQHIGEVAGRIGSDVYAVASPLQAPFIAAQTRRMGHSSQIVHLEDFAMPPRDEIIIAGLMGKTLNHGELVEYASRDVKYWRECSGKDKINFNQDFAERHRLKSFLELTEELNV